MPNYKKLYVMLMLVAATALAGAQTDTLTKQDKYIESELVSLAGKDGISLKSVQGDFLFKPYLLIQTKAIYNYYDDEGLNLAEQDNVLNSGFAVPYALVGFAGRAFNKITFNVAINTATTGAALLNQAWFDVNFSDALRLRIGKFKTPYNQAYLVRVGQTLFSAPPSSLTTSVNIPFSLNSFNPRLATGFDLGMQLHGLLAHKIDYRLGIFNGTGIHQNAATRTASDDMGIPALLYAGRVAYMPWGKVPMHQGSPGDLAGRYLSLAASASYNVEANSESSNDMRLGIEASLMVRRLFLSLEAYSMTMDFVERQRESANYRFSGCYLQAGYFITQKLQPALRLDVMDRNGAKHNGFLYMPALGLNYYVMNHNLKLQAMYQHMGKQGHGGQLLANDDDNGMPEHMASVQLQFAF